MYECDQLYYDYTNGHLCKHIHRVDSIRLLETNDLDKDFQYESLCTSNTHESTCQVALILMTILSSLKVYEIQPQVKSDPFIDLLILSIQLMYVCTCLHIV